MHYGDLPHSKAPCCKQVVAGQTTESFKRYLYPGAVHRSFSLLYKDSKSDNATRTLDLTASSEQDFELWFCGLQVQPQSCAICYGKRMWGEHVADQISIKFTRAGADLYLSYAVRFCTLCRHWWTTCGQHPRRRSQRGGRHSHGRSCPRRLLARSACPFGGPESGASLKSPPIAVPKMLQITDGTSKLSPPGLGGGTAQVILSPKPKSGKLR